ncbi:hypothetical protein LA345_38885 (plasmid) [Burkholderia vietnamiensis]|uniref:ParB/Sulfiredoxin domain-containing protein n=1 Tax=Burkholderia vietnamiensis (strain G4 / LMG 22486) TaxID=269482 RepID=A4JWD7_BURVG|nr:hypothetical protein Bcep1808_7720 [Burkholderia vietnamiensis G4]MCB4349765.1 hypothetical protein [Burkholderia vietnamiensis]
MKLRETNLVSLKKIAEDKSQDAIGIKKVTHYMLDPRAIRIEPGFNARDMVNMSERTRAHIDQMKVAIRAGTVMPAMKVRVSGDTIYVVEGHCRLTAYMELIAEGLEILLVPVEQFNGNDEDRDFEVLNSASQLHLTRLEQGRIYKRRVAFGWSVAQIAARAFKSASFVEQNLMLANADSDVQRLLEADKVSVKVALDAIRKHGDKAGAKLAARIESEGGAKLTGASLTRALPSKVVRNVTAAVSDLFGDTQSMWAARIRECSDSGAVQMMVPVSVMRALLDAHEAATHASAPAKEAA